MGTPEFAVPSLRILVENNYNVVGVITSVDKPAGRGRKLVQSAVKQFAVEHGLNVLQPKNLKAPDFVEELRALKADLQIIVAFRMLPEVVWNMPSIGTFNLHGSLLPKYRGAAPINWAVINGEKETGVTTFFLKHEIDTGDILMQEKLPIGEDETVGEVYGRMMEMGGGVVLKTVKMIEKGGYTLSPQDASKVTQAPKIFPETCEIDFEKTTGEVHNFIRGLSPYPGAWTTLDGKKLKVFKTKKSIENHSKQVGTIVSDDKKFLKIATADGFVEVLELQLQGKKRMDTKAFLNGYNFFESKK